VPGGVGPPLQGLLDGQRLLVDLLEHEVLVAALLGGRQVPVDVVLERRHGVPVQVGHVQPFGGHDHDLVILQDHAVLGPVQEGGEIAGHEVLTLGPPGHQGQVALGPDHDPGVVLVQHGQRERPLQAPDRRPHRVREGPAVGQARLHQVGDTLGVGLGGEPVALALQLGPQGEEVLDDPVVNHRHLAATVQVGMGVAVGRLPVGRPPRVPDPGHPVQRGVGPEGLLERLELPGLADDLDLAAVQHRHPGRVVPPVLEPPQPREQDGERLLVAGVADDATHAVRLPSCDGRRRGQEPIVAAGKPTQARLRPGRPGGRRCLSPPPRSRLRP
jgi:hypothetical protein